MVLEDDARVSLGLRVRFSVRACRASFLLEMRECLSASWFGLRNATPTDRYITCTARMAWDYVTILTEKEKRVWRLASLWPFPHVCDCKNNCSSALAAPAAQQRRGE